MIVRPEIATLRDSDIPQRQAQDALHAAAAQWAEAADVEGVLADVSRFADGAALNQCPALAALFATGGGAADLARGFVGHFAPALLANPLAHMPQRHFHDALGSTLALARRRGTTLTLVAIDGAQLSAQPAPRNASFWPGEAWEMIVAGHGAGEIVTRSDPSTPPRREAITLSPGTMIARNAARKAFILKPFAGLLVSLRLQRRDDAGAEAQEVTLDTGQIAHRAAGRPRDSRLELMMATLGRMGRREAAPHLAALALGAGSTALRWQALRECLALDTGIGISALGTLCDRPGDALSPPAQALHRQLCAQYPELAQVR